MTFRVGIIGCGAISEFHLRAVQSRSDCCAVACADVNREAALRCAAQFGIPRAFTEVESLLRLEDLDLVVICAPPKWHVELLLQSLEYGKHVLVEKPLAMNLTEADTAIEAAAGTDSIMGVEYVHRESWLTDIPCRAEFIGEAGQIFITGESFTKLSLQAQCRDPLPPPYDSLRSQGEVSSEQLQLLRRTQTLFSGLWADMIDRVRLQLQVARLPSLQHARNMQTVVTAAYSGEATRQVCSVDWLPIESCRTT